VNTVLVIEDNVSSRQDLCTLLESSGFQVISAENGKRGLEKVEQYHPDLVITDIFMPVMDGILTIVGLAKQEPGLPVIAICEPEHAAYLKVAEKLGAVSGIEKPIQSNNLLSTIKAYLPATS
jgi:CheY-like chemotaxis protein